MEECDEQFCLAGTKSMCGGALARIAQESVWTGGLDLYPLGPWGCLQRHWRDGQPQILLEVPLRWGEVHPRGWRLLCGRGEVKYVADKEKNVTALLFFPPMVCGEGRGWLGPVAVIEEG